MEDLDVSVAVGEFLVHNVHILKQSKSISVVVYSPDDMVTACIMRYLDLCFETINIVVLHKEGTPPDLAFMRGAAPTLSVSCVEVAKDNNGAEEVKSKLPALADLVVLVRDSKDDLVDPLGLREGILSLKGVMLSIYTGVGSGSVPVGPAIKAANTAASSNIPTYAFCSCLELASQSESGTSQNKSFQEGFREKVTQRHKSQQLRALGTGLDEKKVTAESAEQVKEYWATISVHMNAPQHGSQSTVINWSPRFQPSQEMLIRLKDSYWWPEGRFHNWGLENWEQTRKDWLHCSVKVEPQERAPLPYYGNIIDGLMENRYKYELPQPILLSDLIEIYVDIWDCDMF